MGGAELWVLGGGESDGQPRYTACILPLPLYSLLVHPSPSDLQFNSDTSCVCHRPLRLRAQSHKTASTADSPSFLPSSAQQAYKQASGMPLSGQ